jgi:Arc/MetJ family transcription regulator
MPTNLAIDDQLIEEARKISGLKTKKAVVTEALKEFIQRRQQMEAIKLFGKIDFSPDYDYKTRRRVE